MLKLACLGVTAGLLCGCVSTAVMATGAVVGGAAKATGAVVGGSVDLVTTSDEEQMKKDVRRMKRNQRQDD